MADWLTNVFWWIYSHGFVLAWWLSAASFLSLVLTFWMTGRLVSAAIFGVTGWVMLVLSWFLAATMVLNQYGLVWFIVGTLLGGIGLYPIALYAGFVSMPEVTTGIYLLQMIAIGLVHRYVSVGLGKWALMPPKAA